MIKLKITFWNRRKRRHEQVEGGVLAETIEDMRNRIPTSCGPCEMPICKAEGCDRDRQRQQATTEELTQALMNEMTRGLIHTIALE